MPGYEMRSLSMVDASSVWGVFRDDGGFCQRVEGRAPHSRDVESLFTTCPADVDQSHKHVIGLFDQRTLIAVADVVEGWPTQGTNFIGLLQVKASHHGRGVATTFHEEIVNRYPAAGWRLSVVEANAGVLPFWYSLGYGATGERRTWFNEAGEQHAALVLERKGSVGLT